MFRSAAVGSMVLAYLVFKETEKVFPKVVAPNPNPNPNLTLNPNPKP